MGRKPKYHNSQEIITAFMESVSDSYRHPGSNDEIGDVSGRKKQELLTEEFGISRIKVRKILITTGDLSYPSTKQIQTLLESGMNIGAVCEKMKIAPSTINSFLPYSKGVYGLDVSAAADRTAIYRARKEAVRELKEKMDEAALWRCVCLFSGYPFQTSGRKTKDGVKGQEKFKYEVSKPGSAAGRRYQGEDVDGYGNELWIIQNGEKREKSITRSSVDYALKIVMESSAVTGPKQLKVYGSSYVYALFVRFGVIG